MSYDEWYKNPVYQKKHYDAIISCEILKKEMNENKNLKIFLDQSENFDEIYNLLSQNFSEKHKIMAKNIFEKMKSEQKTGKKFFETLLNIYIRIGYEVGKIKRCIQDAEINWGSYIDRGASYHCNAHSNNLVVLPQGNESLLSPLDLDLAFGKENMIIINKDCPTYGQHDLSYWDNYLNGEFVDLSLNLCGAEDYNFDFDKNKNKNQDSFEIKVRNVISVKELKEDNFLHNIVKLSLICTAEDIA